MSEGYFPDGDPADGDAYKAAVKEELIALSVLYDHTEENDIEGQYLIVQALCELMPYSTSLMLSKGELLEALAGSETDSYVTDAQKCYEMVLSIEPQNARAKLNLGLILLHRDQRANLAHPLVRDAQAEFKVLYELASEAVEDCDFLCGPLNEN